LIFNTSKQGDKHGQRFMASIFDSPKPDIDPEIGELDYQSVHQRFIREPSRRVPAVLEFLRENGVK
jgi:hypothetical protein